MKQIVLDNAAKFGCSGFYSFRDILPIVIGGWIFDSFFARNSDRKSCRIAVERMPVKMSV